MHNKSRLDKSERLVAELKNDHKNRETNCEPPLPNNSFPESIDDSSKAPVTSNAHESKDGDFSMTIICDFLEIEPMEPFEGDINDLIASRMKDIMEVAEEDPNAYSYEESEMKDL